MLHHLFSPSHHLVFQLVERHHLVHETHFEGFLCIVLTAEEPDFTRLLLTHATCQVRRTEACIEAAYLRTCLAEDGILRSDGQVAHHVKHVSATDGKSVHHRNHRFRQ